MNSSQTHQTETRKPAYRWLGSKGRSANDAVLCSSSPDPQQPKKRNFGTDITNIKFVKRSKLNSSVDKKPVKMEMKQDGSSAQRDCNQMQKQQQQCSKGYVFGPFQPTGCHDTGRKGVKRNQDQKSLTSSYHLEYHNQGNPFTLPSSKLKLIFLFFLASSMFVIISKTTVAPLL